MKYFRNLLLMRNIKKRHFLSIHFYNYVKPEIDASKIILLILRLKVEKNLYSQLKKRKQFPRNKIEFFNLENNSLSKL